MVVGARPMIIAYLSNRNSKPIRDINVLFMILPMPLAGIYINKNG